jgi:hypothetical protein
MLSVIRLAPSAARHPDAGASYDRGPLANGDFMRCRNRLRRDCSYRESSVANNRRDCRAVGRPPCLMLSHGRGPRRYAERRSRSCVNHIRNRQPLAPAITAAKPLLDLIRRN